jgi:hypothetical protein
LFGDKEIVMNRTLIIIIVVVVVACILLACCTLAVLLLMGPQIGNVFSQITRDLR